VRARDEHDPYDAHGIARMRDDGDLRAATRTFMGKTFEHGYYRNFTWLGRPIIQYPADVLALQELIWEYRPTLVVETGVAHGGALILYASILELIGGAGDVIGVEVELRPHNRAALAAHPLSKRIHVIEGSSVEPGVVDQVRERARRHERIMVVLDSHHTHEHVLAELRAYAPLVRRGGPLVVFGTSVAELDPSIDLRREWNQSRNPRTALDAFMKETDRFEVDRELNDKLMITDAPDGYLRCIRDPA
jgi:cephalosporin hydroxylase